MRLSCQRGKCCPSVWYVSFVLAFPSFHFLGLLFGSFDSTCLVLAFFGLLTIALQPLWIGKTWLYRQAKQLLLQLRQPYRFLSPCFYLQRDTFSSFSASIGALATMNFSGISRRATSSTRSSSRILSRVRHMLGTWRHLSLLACHQYHVTLLFPLLFPRLPWQERSKY